MLPSERPARAPRALARRAHARPTAALAGAALAALAACSPPDPKTPSAEGDEPTLAAVAPGVFVHTTWAVVRDLGRYPANGLLVCESGHGLLVDTAWTDAQTARLLDVAAARGCPVGELIVTHGHDDRMGGIAEVRRRGIRTFAGAETVARAPRGAFDEALPKPAEEVRAGAVTAEVFFPGPAHTRDNVVVWLPASKVLFGGCMVRAASGKTLGNVADADVAAWPDSARALMDRYGQASVVVPGHGDPGGPELLAHTLALALAARPR